MTAPMLGRPRGKASAGDIWTCSCRFCRYKPGPEAKRARRRIKRRERQAWKGHGRRALGR